MVFSINIAVLCLVGFTSETEQSVLNPRFDHKTDYENAVLERFELFMLQTTDGSSNLLEWPQEVLWPDIMNRHYSKGGAVFESINHNLWSNRASPLDSKV